jgi:hypothetical protein
MDAGWVALLIAVALVFAIFTLVQHWRRFQRDQTRTIARLFERVRLLESISDPAFLERLNEVTPMPLQRVFTLSVRMDDRFWTSALHLSGDDLKFIREFGTQLGSVKLEQWRSHTVANITEILPERKAAGWQTRSFEFYSDPGKDNEPLTLWEVSLSRPDGSPERPPSLELLLRANSLDLCAHLPMSASNGSGNGNGHNGAHSGTEDVLFFSVPLDTDQLARFRSHDPAENENGSVRPLDLSTRTNSWQAYYEDKDESLGVEWHLRLNDLTRRFEWENWKVLESTPVRETARR